MEKDFDKWNSLKKKINKESNGLSSIYWREKEIWFCSLGVNVGSEQDGKNEFFERPVVIIKKVSPTTFLAIPLTSKRKIGSWYVHLDSTGTSAVITQIRLLDSSRLNRRLRIISDLEHKLIIDYFKDYL